MPTVFSHAVFATAVGQWLPTPEPKPRPADTRRFWMSTVVCAMLPDVDVIGFAFGVRYDDMFGHRGFTHSIVFAVLVGFLVARARDVGGWRLGVLWTWFTAATLSHGLLDALTNGGRGVAFFAPITNDRYFFPWRPIQVSPIGAGFFSPRGLRVLASESVWLWLPSAIIAAFARVVRRR